MPAKNPGRGQRGFSVSVLVCLLIPILLVCIGLAVDGAAMVFTRIRPACSGESAAPTLNPNQPNHRMAAPNMTKGRLWGRWLGSLPKP